ncbi:MAG: GAF domain-containing protein [Chitinivibrionales bacterium]|nr:GAF domain-containing protein [Chitinivibrionales bacterium]MBD3396022.1 GAF domain-containing protein [Chitinivibrionales bacterium]
MSLRSDEHNIAIVGINQETAALFPLLLDTHGVRIVRILNHEHEDLAMLKHHPDLDVVIDTTNDAEVNARLRALQLNNADIVGSLSARIFFLTGKREILRGGSPADRESVLNSLHEIRQAILLSKNKEELLKLILNVAIRSVAADTGSIMLLDSERRYLTIEIADGLAPEIVTSTAQRLGKGIAGKVVKEGRPVLLKGPVEQGSEGRGRRTLISSICCPFLIGRDPVGAVSVNSTTPGKEFTESDLAFIKQLVGFTADVIRTSKEFERSARSAFSQSLLESARSIIALEYPFEERLNLLLLRAVNSLSGEICNYYTYNRDDQSFLLKASSSFKFELLRGKRLKFNAQLSRKVLEKRKTVSVDVVDKVTGQRKWYVAQPILVEGELVGLLFLHLIRERAELGMETETIKKIGDMLADELSKNLQLEASRVKSEKLSAITEASYDLASARNLNELAQVVVSVVCLVLEAQNCVLRVRGKKEGQLDILDSFSLGSSQHFKEIRELDDRIAREAFGSSTALALSGVRDITKYGAREVCTSVLSMCLQVDGRRLGTLSIYDKAAVDMFGSSDFTKSDKDVFVNVCLQTAKALSRFVPLAVPAGS